MLRIWCCVSITERELFLTLLVGDSPSEQDTTTTTSLGPGQENMLVDAVTSASFFWWRGQSSAWWLVIAPEKSEWRWSILPEHYAFQYSLHFVARGFQPVNADQQANGVRRGVPAPGGRALHQVHLDKNKYFFCQWPRWCACEFITKWGIISSSRWRKLIKKPREDLRRPEKNQEYPRSLEKPWEALRIPRKGSYCGPSSDTVNFAMVH